MPSKREKEKERTRALKQKKWDEENALVLDFRRKAPVYKTVLRHRGCNLRFYDHLDSYADEFSKSVQDAMSDYPSLLGVHEVSDKVFFEEDLGSLGYSHLIKAELTIGEENYNSKNRDAVFCGAVFPLRDGDGRLRHVILIRQSVNVPVEHRETKYQIKLASLWHEVGHLHDFAHEINEI